MVSISRHIPKWQLWLLADLLIFTVFALLAWQYFPSRHEFADRLDAALKMLHGRLPYIDIPAEYPPLTYFFFLLPALFFRSPVSYYIAYMVQLLLVDVLAVSLIAKVSSRLGISVTRSLVIHALLLIAVGPILAATFDIIPAVLTLVALYFFIEGRNNWAWAFTGLGFMTKIFPAVLVPLFVLYLWRQKQYRQIFQGAAIFIGIALALSLPFLILDAKAYSTFATYQMDRPLHSESVYASILLVGKLLGLDNIAGVYNYGSWNLTSSVADNFAQMSFYITMVLFVLAYYLYWRSSRSESERSGSLSSIDTISLLRFSAASLMLLIVSLKVLSMQYLVWLMPLLLFVRGRWQVPACAAFAAAGIIGQFIYPYNYNLFQNFSPPVMVLMLFRNILLVLTAVILLLPAERKLTS